MNNSTVVEHYVIKNTNSVYLVYAVYGCHVSLAVTYMYTSDHWLAILVTTAIFLYSVGSIPLHKIAIYEYLLR